MLIMIEVVLKFAVGFEMHMKELKYVNRFVQKYTHQIYSKLKKN